jgi:putative membrane protein (TIGR04086 family)
MRGKFYKRTDISAVKRLFLGAGMAMAALLLFSAIFSGISMLTDDAAAKIPLFAILTLVVSAAVGGAVSTRTVSDGRLSLALLSALLAALIFMLIGTIIGKGHLPLSVFLNFAIFVGVFGLSSYLFKKRDIGKKRRFK